MATTDLKSAIRSLRKFYWTSTTDLADLKAEFESSTRELSEIGKVQLQLAEEKEDVAAAHELRIFTQKKKRLQLHVEILECKVSFESTKLLLLEQELRGLVSSLQSVGGGTMRTAVRESKVFGRIDNDSHQASVIASPKLADNFALARLENMPRESENLVLGMNIGESVEGRASDVGMARSRSSVGSQSGIRMDTVVAGDVQRVLLDEVVSQVELNLYL